MEEGERSVNDSLEINSELLFERARKLAEANSMLVVTAGNAISLYAMFVLREILVQQATDPITNLSNIITLSDTISSLNSTLTAYSIVR